MSNIDSQSDLYTRIINGITILGNWTDNEDGTSNVNVDLTDDAVAAWEQLYKMPIAKGFNEWFNKIIKKAMEAESFKNKFSK